MLPIHYLLNLVDEEPTLPTRHQHEQRAPVPSLPFTKPSIRLKNAPSHHDAHSARPNRQHDESVLPRSSHGVNKRRTSPQKSDKYMYKGPWRPAETALLAKLVQEHGPYRWSEIARHIPGRTGKQARERWKNHLDPTLKKGKWTAEEDAIITANFQLIGKKWSTIARLLPGRSDNDVKNRFNGTIRARERRAGSTQHQSATEFSNSVQSEWLDRPSMFSMYE